MKTGSFTARIRILGQHGSHRGEAVRTPFLQHFDAQHVFRYVLDMYHAWNLVTCHSSVLSNSVGIQTYYFVSIISGCIAAAAAGEDVQSGSQQLCACLSLGFKGKFSSLKKLSPASKQASHNQNRLSKRICVPTVDNQSPVVCIPLLSLEPPGSS